MSVGPDHVLVVGAVNKLGDIRDQVSTWPKSEKKTKALIWLDVYSLPNTALPGASRTPWLRH